MPPNLRRLAADQAALHNAHLPPYYLFPPENELSASADDLTQLTVLLAGPQGTAYANGLWRLHLKMPEDYPRSPPKASFRTRIWHPNVEESAGSVCVDTLKRDWEAKLTLKDVLVTISCLLIYPNPDSALNSTAGALLQEDYDAFSRQAKIMTSIHAPVPDELNSAVNEAKLRGEDAGTIIQEQQENNSPLRPQKDPKAHSLRMKKNAQPSSQNHIPEPPIHQHQHQQTTHDLSSDEEEENPATATKENDPSLSPSPVKLAPPSPRKNAHGKRPLSVLTMSPDPSDAMEQDQQIHTNGIEAMTASEKNIAANDSLGRDSSPTRKSPKLSSSSSSSPPPPSSSSILPNSISNPSTRLVGIASAGGTEDVTIFEDTPNPISPKSHSHSHTNNNHRTTSANTGKENLNNQHRTPTTKQVPLRSSGPGTHHPHGLNPTTQLPNKTMNQPLGPGRVSASAPSSSASGSGAGLNARRKPRVGIRRL